jgi:hypothetical protein
MKVRLSSEHERLDIISEARNLNSQEMDSLQHISKELGNIWSMEGIKARERDIKEGDRNTRYTK